MTLTPTIVRKSFFPVRWADPEVNRVFDAFNRGFGAPDSGEVLWNPPFDVQESEDHYVLRTEVPGVDPAHIDVSVENHVLTVTGEKKHESEETGAAYHRRERVFGRFERSFRLPRAVDAEAIRAVCKNGVLELTVPKAPEARPRRIPVNN